MASFRSKIIRNLLAFPYPRRVPYNAETLAAKRRKFARRALFFPVLGSAHIERADIPGVKAEWIVTARSRPHIVMLYMHGGGFVLNAARIHRDLIARIARTARVAALSVDYSLSPEHPFPTAQNEVMEAYKWLLEGEIDPKHIVIAGDSAGGALALGALHLIKAQGLPMPAAAVVIAPPTDASFTPPPDYAHSKRHDFIKPESIEFFVDSYFGQTPRDHPVASPLLGSLAGFPPLLVHTSRDEYLHIASERLVDKARREGVEVEFYEPEKMPHVWHLYARYMPEARTAIEDIGAFIRTHTR
ncbi:MAG TPA: alpha/beta hydrolase [Candidatus Saccharimonadia bacterium]|jgi:acetyl esterase/lipase|nr:alpha/beta hydrolase [Candidatus Saccharimonadia bacterium]